MDLHIHTSASDGSDSPTDVVKHAKSIGLVGIAITDHDTVQGVEEGIATGLDLGVTVVPGVEISSLWEDHPVHLLGYYIDTADPGLTSLLELMRKGREKRLPKMLARLRAFDINIEQSEVETEAMGESTGRPHIARVMVRRGFVSSVEEAFDKFLAYGRPAYVDRPRPSIAEGIQTILKAKGIPVIAHPLIINVPLKKTLSELKHLEIQGVEYYYPYEYVTGHPQEWYATLKNRRQHLKQLALRHKLILTGGSDYHGSGPGKAALGECEVPVTVLQSLQQRYETLFGTPP